MRQTLHYFFDPLCGWCYGAEPLVLAAAGVEVIELHMHAGGLWPQPTYLPDAARRHIREADARVAAMSGQPYGEAYFDGLLFDPGLVLDSAPTTAAVLAAESLASGAGLDMLVAIQHAHYERGLHVVRAEVLERLARVELGLDGQSFAAAMARAPVEGHIAQTRRLMDRLGVRGFPAFVIETDTGPRAVPHHDFAGKSEAFAQWLSTNMQATAP